MVQTKKIGQVIKNMYLWRSSVTKVATSERLILMRKETRAMNKRQVGNDARVRPYCTKHQKNVYKISIF